MGYEIFSGNTPWIRGVIFDMDGVILDTEKLYTRFWREASGFYGFPMSLEQALGMRSLGPEDGKARILSYFGPGADYRAIRDKRVELMADFIEQEGILPKPGVRELMAYLKGKGIKTAIATSSPAHRARKHLASVGFDVLFDQICSGHEVANPKPAPDLYIHAAEKLGLAPEECLAVEDSPTGLRSAHDAGCHAVMIPDMDQPDGVTLSLLFALGERLTDIIGILEDISKNPIDFPG